MQHIQPALPLIHRDGERITIPNKTVIVATTDPDVPHYVTTTSTAPVVAIVRQPDGAEWVWWQAKGGYLKAAVLVDGRLPVIQPPLRRKPKAVLPPRWCKRCGDRLPPTKPANAKYCSARCRKYMAELRRDARRANRQPCRMEGCNRRGCRKHYPHGHRHRAAYWGVPYESIVPTAVYNRDNWVCGLCGLPVSKRLKRPDPMSVSLDHIIPLSKGGGHVWENVQCSHLVCNLRKSNLVPHPLPPGLGTALCEPASGSGS